MGEAVEHSETDEGNNCIENAIIQDGQYTSLRILIQAQACPHPTKSQAICPPSPNGGRQPLCFAIAPLLPQGGDKNVRLLLYIWRGDCIKIIKPKRCFELPTFGLFIVLDVLSIVRELKVCTKVTFVPDHPSILNPQILKSFMVVRVLNI